MATGNRHMLFPFLPSQRIGWTEANLREGISPMAQVKVAIVTGAGTGVGKAASLALMAAGYQVVLSGRRKEPLEQTAKEGAAGGGKALVVPTDVRDPQSIKALFAKTR